MSVVIDALRRLRDAVILATMSERGVRRVVNGIPFRVDPIGRHMFARDYDAGAASYLRGRLRNGMEAWNVGANVGTYALQLAHWVGEHGRVIAFEPNPEARRVLTHNLALNGVQPRVEIVPSAVGEAPGQVDFFTSGADGMARAGRANPLYDAPHRIQVPVVTLDDFAAARGRTPDVVVMDIEGWEIAALRGARSLLPCTRFVIELHPGAWSWSGHSRADLEAILDESRLVVEPVSGQRDPMTEQGQVVLQPR